MLKVCVLAMHKTLHAHMLFACISHAHAYVFAMPYKTLHAHVLIVHATSASINAQAQAKHSCCDAQDIAMNACAFSNFLTNF